MNFDEMLNYIEENNLNEKKSARVYFVIRPPEMNGKTYADYVDNTFQGKVIPAPYYNKPNTVTLMHISENNNRITYYDEKGIFMSEDNGLSDIEAITSLISTLEYRKAYYR